jgi:hypothetical protein
MPGVGEVLFRHKVTSPRWVIALTTLLPSTLLLGLGTALSFVGKTGAGLALVAGGLGLGALMGALMVTFASARVVVSEGELHVQIGMAGPRVPMAEIESVAIAPSGGNKLGMGASIDLRGNRYIRMWGRNEDAVHVRLKSGTSIVLTTKEPEPMAAALREALARRDRMAPRVRVDAEQEVVAVESEPPRTSESEVDG